MRALLLLLLLAVAAVWFGALPPGLLPPAWDPNAPLDVRAEPGPLLGLKLRRLRGDPALCRAALASAESRARPVPDVPVRDGCGLQDAVRVSGGGEAGGVGFEPGPFLASCPLAVGWASFEAHVLQPAARRHFDRPIVGVAHLGSYACRDVRGGAARSSHATADALDVSGFTLRGGRRVSLADWAGPEGRTTPEAAFLREVRDGACRFFGTVLSPEYDRAHADHLHLQATGWGRCR